MKVKCPYCDYDNPDTSSFCANCAENILDTYNTKAARLQRIQKQHHLKTNIQGSNAGCTAVLLVLGVLAFIGVFAFVFISKAQDLEKNEKNSEIIQADFYVNAIYVKSIFADTKVYSAGFTGDKKNDTEYHVFVKDLIISHKMAKEQFTGVFDNTKKEFDIFAGISTDDEFFFINKNNCEIDGKNFNYDENISRLISSYSVNCVVVLSRHVIFFFGNSNVIIAKRKEAKRVLETIILESIRVNNNIIINAFFDEDESVLYLTDGNAVYRFAYDDIEIAFTDFMNNTNKSNQLKLNIKNEFIMALARNENTFFFVTSPVGKKFKNIYKLDSRTADNYFDY